MSYGIAVFFSAGRACAAAGTHSLAFPKIKGTILRVPVIRTVVSVVFIWASILGSPYFAEAQSEAVNFCKLI